MTTNVISVQQLTKGYKEGPVLKDLSLFVSKGAVFGLLGKNGAGKTTLIKCLLGLLRPTSGRIAVLQDDPLDFQDVTKARIGYVPQAGRPYPWLTVEEILNYTGSFYPAWNQELVRKLAAEWELKFSSRVGLLSEGQAQKLSIILALGHEPELLIFDEPVASLDPYARRQFLKMILDILSNRPCTIFFSTHITSDLERVASHVGILKGGGIDFLGELDVLKDEVKRLRIKAGRAIAPEEINFEGVLRCELIKEDAILAVRNFSAEKRAWLENKFKGAIEVEDLNLEEIFLELNR